MNALIAVWLASSAAGVLAQPADIGPAPGTLVEVDGGKLHLHCTGAGAPTVIIEAGASAFAIDFALVQPDIARTNRVCAYDRFGHGWSDGRDAGSPERVVATLHTLLQTAGEHAPFVLVGASRGGLYVRLYQARYPDQVAALVLIDPAHEDRLFTFFQGQAVAIAELSAEQFRSTIPPGAVKIPSRSPQTGTPFDRLPPDLYKLRLALDARLIASMPPSVSYEARVESAEAERAMLAELRERSRSAAPALGDRPLIVLTRGVDSSQELRELHASMARLSTSFRHTVVAGAGHEIHLFAPAAVSAAIQDAVTAVKNRTRPRPQID